ncbi:MAG: helix-turn-helix transcriptional regulator [Dehalococcoidia bacterium]
MVSTKTVASRNEKSGASDAGWTLVTNHELVLGHLALHPVQTVRQVASHLGLTERTIHKIITDLESVGYIRRRKVGRRNMYRVSDRLPLRHPTKQDVLVSDFLSGLNPREKGGLVRD